MTQPIDAQFDQDELSTSHKFNMIDTQPSHIPPAIQLTVAHLGPNMAGSDRSIDPVEGHRACAYCVQIDGLRHSGAMQYPPSTYSTSHRSELEGVYNTLLIKQQLCNRSLITQHIDNSEAVDASNHPIYTQRQAIAPEADIILAIHTLHTKLLEDGGDTKIQWIKAHQDDNCKTSDLSPPSQLNVDMDTASKHSRTNHAITYPDPTPYPGSGAMLIIGGLWITTKYNEQIRDAMTAATHHTFFTKKYHIIQATYNDFDWIGIGRASKSLPLSTNIQLTKMLNGWLNTGEQQAHMHQTGKCPCCGWPQETQLHMFQCRHPDVTRTRATSIANLTKYYHDSHVPPEVYAPLLRMIKSSCRNTDLTWTKHLSPTITKAIANQTILGHDLTLRGYLSREWMMAIHHYNPDKPDRIACHILLGLWTLLFQPTWTQRNIIKHGPTSIVARIERDSFLLEINEWKQNAGARLGAAQIYLVMTRQFRRGQINN